MFMNLSTLHRMTDSIVLYWLNTDHDYETNYFFNNINIIIKLFLMLLSLSQSYTIIRVKVEKNALPGSFKSVLSSVGAHVCVPIKCIAASISAFNAQTRLMHPIWLTLSVVFAKSRIIIISSLQSLPLSPHIIMRARKVCMSSHAAIFLYMRECWAVPAVTDAV